MGILSWMLDIGIRVEEGAQLVGTRMGAIGAQWPAGAHEGSIISRLPRDPHQRASLFAKKQTVIVNDGEVALVFDGGTAKGALSPGAYVFEKVRVSGVLDVLWVKTGQRAIKWGVGNISSTDGIQVGANGTVYVKVTDAVKFNSEIVQGALLMPEVDLQRFLLPRVQGVLRGTIAKWAAMDLQVQREMFSDAVKNSLSEPLEGMGLSIVELEVVEVSLPAEFKSAIAQATLATHSGRAALVEAQSRAQVMQLDSAAMAQAQLTAGLAQAQVMGQLMAQGIDPMKLKALEALNTMAANPGQGMVVGGDMRAAMFGQIAAAALAPSPQVAAIPSPRLPAAQDQLVPTQAVAAAATDPVADLERQIDALVERLAEGKITEETYKTLVARLEAKLQRVRGG